MKNVCYFRSSPQRCSVRNGFLINFAKFTGKHLRQSLFFNKVAGPRSATLSKKRPWQRCFPVNFAKILRTPFLQNTSGRLLLSFLIDHFEYFLEQKFYWKCYCILRKLKFCLVFYQRMRGQHDNGYL